MGTKDYVSIHVIQNIINLNKSIDKKSIKILSSYFDNIFDLCEILFKGIIKLHNKDIEISKKVFFLKIYVR